MLFIYVCIVVYKIQMRGDRMTTLQRKLVQVEQWRLREGVGGTGEAGPEEEPPSVAKKCSPLRVHWWKCFLW